MQFNEGWTIVSGKTVRAKCCSKSSAALRFSEINLKGMDWPTQQSFYSKTILFSVKAHVCALVDTSYSSLRKACPT
jgi:hypothetical protein